MSAAPFYHAQSERSITINPTAKKRGLQPDMRALVIAAPSGYLKSLAPLPEGVVISEAMGGTQEFVQFFATRKSDIEKSSLKLLKAATPGALVWITYPKKTSGVESDLSREAVWAAMEGTGWRPVSQIMSSAPSRCRTSF